MLTVKDRIDRAVEELALVSEAGDLSEAVQSLGAGMTNLRNLLLRRVHQDVESRYGIDSMLAPMSAVEEDRELTLAKIEIEIYGSIVAADEMAKEQYVNADFAWCKAWLTRLRLGDGLPASVARRMDKYLPRSAAERRLLFSNVLARTVPETHKAPLLTFRLYPMAIRQTVAMAFGGQLAAAQWRNKQVAMLQQISDCLECHGRVLENGETCPNCGNPFWKLHWLCATD